jgi:hypothetical protein
MTEYQADNIYFIGDTHTLAFFHKLEEFDFKDFILIHVGDAGEGFAGCEYNDRHDLARLNEFCTKNNGRILIVRGNHSNPAFYRPDHWSTEFDKITFVPDYTYLNINGKICLFVGGAISIDRTQRIAGIDYWEDEVFVLREDYTQLPQCDVLVTHSSPISAYPNDGLAAIKHWLDRDPPLREELIEERKNIQLLFDHVYCNKLFYGHFHHSASIYSEGCYMRCLNIDEIFDATYEFR